jgi:hypothetical protein
LSVGQAKGDSRIWAPAAMCAFTNMYTLI